MAEKRERTEEQKQRARERKREVRQRNVENGLCMNCGKFPPMEGVVLCKRCRDRRNATKRKLYENRTFEQRLAEAEKERMVRERWENTGLCTGCGQRPPVEGRKRCEVCIEKERTYYEKTKNIRNKNRRRLFADRKARGICIQCGVKDAMPGKSRCGECLAYQASVENRCRERKTDEQMREKRRKNTEHERLVREQRAKDGLCIKCARKKPDDGYLTCETCRAADRSRKAAGKIPRNEWPDYGLCYICGKNPIGKNPDGEQMRVCTGCRDRIMEKTVNSGSEANLTSRAAYIDRNRREHKRIFLK